MKVYFLVRFDLICLLNKQKHHIHTPYLDIHTSQMDFDMAKSDEWPNFSPKSKSPNHQTLVENIVEKTHIVCLFNDHLSIWVANCAIEHYPK